MNDPDHDLLIRIESKMDGLNHTFIDHVSDAGGRFKELENRVGAAHRRIDWLLISGILSIIGLTFTVWMKIA